MPNDAPANTAELRAQLAAARASAALHAKRGELLVHERDQMHQVMIQIRGSLFWRATFPARVLVDLCRTNSSRRTQLRMVMGRARDIANDEGWPAVWRRGRAFLHARKTPSTTAASGQALGSPPATDAHLLLAANVLIVAELSIVQCAKYRVWQKQTMFGLLGMPARVVNWTDDLACRSALATASFVILYRVPADKQVLALITMARALRVPVWYDLDDLIFDRDLYLQDRNVRALPAAAREGVLGGAPLYRQALLACDGAIASTPSLARAMLAAGVPETLVVENALDEETLTIAENLPKAPPNDGIIIGYGSGSRTHDGDFMQAAPALLAVLRARPQARLRLIGEVTLPAIFADVAAQIECLPATGFASYLHTLAACDISLAPLEPSPFNDAKSNIKFLEAAILGVPSICSPRAHFAEAVDASCGFLADTDAAWEAALLALIDDSELRAKLAQAAQARVRARYTPAAIAQAQLRNLVAKIDAPPAKDLDLLMVNRCFPPQFLTAAAATIAGTAHALARRANTRVSVVTSVDRFTAHGTLTRYDEDGIAVFAIPVPAADAILAFDNPLAAEHFGAILDATQPAIVHFYDIAGMGVALVKTCRSRGIPYVITLHDTWWLCARGTMMREDRSHCRQITINPRACTACLPLARYLDTRATLLGYALEYAALLIAPSDAHRALYLANGADPARIVTLPDGITMPAQPRRPRASGKIRFCYAGGLAPEDGFQVLARALANWPRDAFDIHLINSPHDGLDWHRQPVIADLGGTVRIANPDDATRHDEFFANIDVVLYPAQAPVGVGGVVHEALVRQVWVITTACGGPAEPVMDGKNGQVLPLDANAAVWRAAIGHALHNSTPIFDTTRPALTGIISIDQHTDTLHEILRKKCAPTPRRHMA